MILMQPTLQCIQRADKLRTALTAVASKGAGCLLGPSSAGAEGSAMQCGQQDHSAAHGPGKTCRSAKGIGTWHANRPAQEVRQGGHAARQRSGPPAPGTSGGCSRVGLQAGVAGAERLAEDDAAGACARAVLVRRGRRSAGRWSAPGRPRPPAGCLSARQIRQLAVAAASRFPIQHGITSQ